MLNTMACESAGALVYRNKPFADAISSLSFLT
jgi:hypothetical protein